MMASIHLAAALRTFQLMSSSSLYSSSSSLKSIFTWRSVISSLNKQEDNSTLSVKHFLKQILTHKVQIGKGYQKIFIINYWKIHIYICKWTITIYIYSIAFFVQKEKHFSFQMFICPSCWLIHVWTSILRNRSPTGPNKFKSATIIPSHILIQNSYICSFHEVAHVCVCIFLFDVLNLICNSSYRRKKSAENHF